MTVQSTVTVSHADLDGAWIVVLEGEHDLATMPLVEEKTRGVWSHQADTVVDLSDATFIDSSIVHWLLRARSTTTANGNSAGSIHVVTGDPAGPAARLLDLLNVTTQLVLHPGGGEHATDAAVPAAPRRLA